MTSISLPQDIYEQLRLRAQQTQVSPDVLVETAVRQYLQAHDQQWRAALERILARVHAHASQFDAVEIEADITYAVQEVKASHRDRSAD